MRVGVTQIIGVATSEKNKTAHGSSYYLLLILNSAERYFNGGTLERMRRDNCCCSCNTLGLVSPTFHCPSQPRADVFLPLLWLPGSLFGVGWCMQPVPPRQSARFMCEVPGCSRPAPRFAVSKRHGDPKRTVCKKWSEVRPYLGLRINTAFAIGVIESGEVPVFNLIYSRRSVSLSQVVL